MLWYGLLCLQKYNLFFLIVLINNCYDRNLWTASGKTHVHSIKIHVQFVYAFLAKALFFYKWS